MKLLIKYLHSSLLLESFGTSNTRQFVTANDTSQQFSLFAMARAGDAATAMRNGNLNFIVAAKCFSVLFVESSATGGKVFCEEVFPEFIGSAGGLFGLETKRCGDCQRQNKH